MQVIISGIVLKGEHNPSPEYQDYLVNVVEDLSGDALAARAVELFENATTWEVDSYDFVRPVADTEFRPGIYRHYKGDTYLAVGLCRRDETNETEVVYTRLYERDGIPLSGRLLHIWNQYVDSETGDAVKTGGVPRFTYVGNATP